jgi:prepilin-type N-terminal cleavage/methylation domain-containing protein/prepilin-type processing-associated H-X9-DG protein
MKRRSGFTLVELLATVAIVGLLIGLLLPAIQSARESARRTSCANNIKQLALACLSYVESQGHFPSGGWAFQHTGDPDGGLGPKQSGGWAFQLLPFVEQNAIFTMGSDGVPGISAAQSTLFKTQRCAIPVSQFVCPSRRTGALPAETNNQGYNQLSAGLDYIANAGDVGGVAAYGGADSNSWGYDSFMAHYQSLPANLRPSGVIHPISRITAAQITDGLSVTLLLGERYRNRDAYGTAVANIYGGTVWSLSLGGIMADTPGFSATMFGSTHPSAAGFAFCDGSVRPISFSVSTTLFVQLRDRKDRNPLTLDEL